MRERDMMGYTSYSFFIFYGEYVEMTVYVTRP
jgi:hypothetical protein